jgi:hypothetical protein
MTQAFRDTSLPSLFAHATRKDWGIGVLVWDDGGKRGYLFENGEERTMASGFHELMRKVEHPSPDQQAVSRRLQRMLAARPGESSPSGTAPTFAQQLVRFHEVYPGGLLDPKWVRQIRGEGAEQPNPQHRAVLLQDAQEQLSVNVLDSFLANQHFEQLWESVMRVLDRATDLVPAAQLKKLKLARPGQSRELAVAVRELLHGTDPQAQRFDRYVAALTARAGEPARWEVATALSAIVNPKDDVCVHPKIFGLQLKAIGLQSVVGARPGGATYARLLAVARDVAKKLDEQGEQPRDLLDIHDFMRITLKPAVKARVSPAKPSARKAAPPSEDDPQDE